MKTALAIRHVAFEDLGLVGEVLAERGWVIAYQDAWAIDREAAERADLLVLLGGPISINDARDYPFVETEVDLARARIAADRPLLGICLGAQAMARAIGGAVRPGTAREIGWAPLELTEAGRASVLRHLDGVPVLHWHGEVCELPDGVASLARTAVCAAQAFAPAPRALALQFHVEAGANGIEPWLVGHTAELGTTPGVAIGALRAATEVHGPAVARAGRAMLGEWLEAVGL